LTSTEKQKKTTKSTNY